MISFLYKKYVKMVNFCVFWEGGSQNDQNAPRSVRGSSTLVCRYVTDFWANVQGGSYVWGADQNAPTLIKGCPTLACGRFGAMTTKRLKMAVAKHITARHLTPTHLTPTLAPTSGGAGAVGLRQHSHASPSVYRTSCLSPLSGAENAAASP